MPGAGILALQQSNKITQMHLQENRINTQGILQHFGSDFIEKHNQEDIFIEVIAQLIQKDDPYIIIQNLIEKNNKLTGQLATAPKDNKSFQVDTHRYYELERTFMFGTGEE